MALLDLQVKTGLRILLLGGFTCVIDLFNMELLCSEHVFEDVGSKT